MPSVGSISILRSSEALRVPCHVRAKVLAPFRPMRVSASRRDPSPHRATPCNLGLPRGSPRWPGEDASLRPLQPTVDTSTRRPFDFRARSLRCTDRRMLPLLLSLESGRGRVLPCDAGPPCGNPTPAGRVLDGTPPASADPYTVLLAFRLGRSGHRLWRCHLGVAFSAMREADVRPLTLPVAPRSLPEC